MNEVELIRDLQPDGDTPPRAGARTDARARLDAAIATEQARPARTSRGSWRWLAAASVVALVAAGGFALTRPGDGPSGPDLVFSDAQVRFPYETASDVVSYSDHVVVVTAVAEAEIPENAPPERVAAGEGEVFRRVTFRVDKTLWSRTDAQPVPTEFTAVWWGWVLRDHQRTRTVAHGAAWVDVGSTYVMPIAHDGKEFAPIQTYAMFPLNGGVVSPGPGQDTALAKRLRGVQANEVAQVFAHAVPDPAADRSQRNP